MPARTDGAARAPPGGADLALVTDAGTPVGQRPGRRAGGGLGRPRAGSWCRCRARRRSWPRSRDRGWRARAGHSKGSCPAPGASGRERLARIAADDRGTILYEAPTRVGGDPAGPRRGVRAGPARGRLPRADQAPRIDRARVAGRTGGRGGAGPGPSRPRGEFAIVVGDWRGARPADAADEASVLAAAQAEVEALVAAGVARGDAARQVAAATGLPRRRLYGLDTSR